MKTYPRLFPPTYTLVQSPMDYELKREDKQIEKLSEMAMSGSTLLPIHCRSGINDICRDAGKKFMKKEFFHFLYALSGVVAAALIYYFLFYE